MEKICALFDPKTIAAFFLFQRDEKLYPEAKTINLETKMTSLAMVLKIISNFTESILAILHIPFLQYPSHFTVAITIP